MGLIEAILAGLQFKGLEKPVVFVTMLIGLILFSVFGLSIMYIVVQGLSQGAPALPSLGLAAFSVVFFALVPACGYFIKRCFE